MGEITAQLNQNLEKVEKTEVLMFVKALWWFYCAGKVKNH